MPPVVLTSEDADVQDGGDDAGGRSGRADASGVRTVVDGRSVVTRTLVDPAAGEDCGGMYTTERYPMSVAASYPRHRFRPDFSAGSLVRRQELQWNCQPQRPTRPLPTSHTPRSAVFRDINSNTSTDSCVYSLSSSHAKAAAPSRDVAARSGGTAAATHRSPACASVSSSYHVSNQDRVTDTPACLRPASGRDPAPLYTPADRPPAPAATYHRQQTQSCSSPPGGAALFWESVSPGSSAAPDTSSASSEEARRSARRRATGLQRARLARSCPDLSESDASPEPVRHRRHRPLRGILKPARRNSEHLRRDGTARRSRLYIGVVHTTSVTILVSLCITFV